MIEPSLEELPRGAEQSQIVGSTASVDTFTVGEDDVDPDKLAKRLLAMARAAVTHANSTDLGARRKAMARANEAYRGQHADGSKYKQKTYSSRSKLFIPKTRSAVKAKMVAARAALFGTEQAVAITAEDDTDPRQQASAELNTALINYRLDRATGKRAGLPWMKISMGAAFDACVAGVCISKTSWEFVERFEEVDASDETYDPENPPNDVDPDLVSIGGNPVRRVVTRDRPMIYHIEPENVIVDTAAPWWDVVQEGQFFIVKHPMKVGDVKAMMKPGAQHLGGGPWYDIPDKVMAMAVADTAAINVRSARTGGQDRYSRSSQPAVTDFDVVWVHENFIRVDGVDYHFWSLGTRQLLSKPGEVGTLGHYPAHHGERPYVMGVGSIEPHVALPMSHVEAWRPLQDEINDIRNLRLDTMKQSISPITFYRMNANVDLRAVRERGPDAMIGVTDLEKDIKFDRVTGPDASSYAETDRLNSEFDELAGSFATSTVQSSRAIGETARGMQLVNSTANSVQEFDLAVFLETWAEPTIRHLVWLEQYYETDNTLMALLARKAHLYERFGQSFELDQILEQQLTVKVNIGPGAGDPVQKLQRINAAVDMSLKIAPTIAGQAQPIAEDLLNEIWASTGVSAHRVFKFLSPEEAEAKAQEMAAKQPNPDVMKAENERKKLELESQKSQLDLMIAREKNELEREKLQIERDRIVAEIERANQDMALKVVSQRADIGFRAASHNKQLVDEAGQAMAGAQGENVTGQPMQGDGAANVIAQIMTGLAQILQQQQATMIAELRQQQEQSQLAMAALIAQVSAPKRVVRDQSGQVLGVETVQ